MTLKQRLRRAGRKQQGADSRRHDAPHSTPSPASPSGVWMAGFPGTGKATFQTSSRLVEDQPLTTDATRRESAFFDRLVTEEGDFNPFAPRGWNTLARRFTEMVPLTDGMRLLDVGCGTGLSRQIYTNKKTDFVGIDLSAEASALLRPSSPTIPGCKATPARFPTTTSSSTWSVSAECCTISPTLARPFAKVIACCGPAATFLPTTPICFTRQWRFSAILEVGSTRPKASARMSGRCFPPRLRPRF